MLLHEVAQDLVLLLSPPRRGLISLVGQCKEARVALDHRLLHVLADDAPGGAAVLLDELEEHLVLLGAPDDLLLLVVALSLLLLVTLRNGLELFVLH